MHCAELEAQARAALTGAGQQVHAVCSAKVGLLLLHMSFCLQGYSAFQAGCAAAAAWELQLRNNHAVAAAFFTLINS